MVEAIQLADARQALEVLLGSLGESALFVTSGSLAPVLPGLEIKGIGSIGMPVVVADAKRIIAKATQARSSSQSQRMLKVIARLKDVKLAERFVRDVLPTDYDGSDGKVLLKVCGISAGRLTPYLEQFLVLQDAEDDSTSIADVVSICVALCCDPPALTEHRTACRSLVDPLSG